MKNNKLSIFLSIVAVLSIVLIIGAYGAFEPKQEEADTSTCTMHIGGIADCQHKAKGTICGKEYGSLGDHREVASPSVAATCTTPGLTQVIKCSTCNKIIKAEKTVPAKGHNMIKVSRLDPECYKDGYTEYEICTDCDYVKGKAIIPACHDFSVAMKGLPETCVEDGYTAHLKCSRCDEVQGKDSIAASHKFVDVNAQPAGCTVDGYTAHIKCSACGLEEGKTDIPAAHKFTVDVAEKASTCDEDGYTAHKACSECGAADAAKTPIPAGHTWIEYTGYHTCDKCGRFESLTPEGTSGVVSSDYIQQIINNVSDGETVYLAPGEYAPFVIQNADGSPKNNITIIGSSDVVFSHIDLNGSDNIVIMDAVFDASLAVMGKQYYSSISFYNSNIQKSAIGARIKNCRFTGTPVDADLYVPICADERGSNLRLTDISIENCSFLSHSLYSIYLPYTAKGTITLKNNVFTNFKMYAISLMRNNADLVITNNVFSFSSRADLYNSAAIMSSSRHEGSDHLITATITGNTFTTASTVNEMYSKFAVFKENYTKSNFSLTFDSNVFMGAFDGVTNSTTRVIYPRY